MKSLQWLLADFFLFVLIATVFGQSNPRPAAYPPDGPIAASSIASPAPFGGAAHGVRSVKGSPFSADVVYEFTQVLAYHNRIHRESHGKIFRDAEGRTRNEIDDYLPPGAEGPQTMIDAPQITISNPESQTFVTLYPQSRRAVVNHMTVVRGGDGREIGVGIAAGSDAASSDAASSDGAAEAKRRAEQLEKLKVLRETQGSAPAGMQHKPIGRMPREELGAKEIEGFIVSGIRYSGTTAAGVIGNEKPIVTVNENWWSEDLKAVLVSIYDQPQSGRRVMRLTNIRAGEPDSQLFQIPADYAVQEFPLKSKTAVLPPH
jgi:hypothetical protein